VKPDPVTDYVITSHAAFEMERRNVGDEIVRSVLQTPEQRMEVRPGRLVLQSRIAMGDPERNYLVRVFVDVDRRPAEVVTVYRTSRISRYWREES
jgi:hypothetical protein